MLRIIGSKPPPNQSTFTKYFNTNPLTLLAFEGDTAVICVNRPLEKTWRLRPEVT